MHKSKVQARRASNPESFVEALALEHPSAQSLPTQFFRFQSDERLIGHIRKGQPKAFETLVKRYQGRLLSFCSQIVNSQEDAEDIVQDVFASAFSAIFADSRPIHVRPWLYRIARNRCLNHLRRPVPAGQESMDVFEQPGGATTVDHVNTREEFRHLVADVRQLPDSQRRALLLREVNSLSYEEIADEMDTSVSSVKSLLARARTSLGEAADSRLLSCDDARAELEGEAESAGRLSATTRRHLKRCEYCRRYRGQLRKPGLKAAALLFPLPVIGSVKKLVSAKLTAATGGVPPAAGAAGAGLTGAGLPAAGISGAGLSGAGVSGAAATGGAITGGAGVVATKAAVSIVAAGLVTAGAYEARQVAPEQTLAENLALTHPDSVQNIQKQGPQAAGTADKARPASGDVQRTNRPPEWAPTPPGQDRPASSPTEATAGGQTTTSQPGAKPRHHLTAAEQGASIASIGSRATSQSVYGSPSTWSSSQSDQYRYGQSNGPVGTDGLLSSPSDTQAQGTGSSSAQGVQDVPFAVIGSSASSLSSSSQGQSQQSGQSPSSQQQTSSGGQASPQSQGSAQTSTSSNSRAEGQTSSQQGSQSSSSSSQSSSQQSGQSEQNTQSGSQQQQQPQQQSTRQSQGSQSQNYQSQSSQSGG